MSEESPSVSESFAKMAEELKTRNLKGVFVVGVAEDGAVASMYQTAGAPIDILTLYAYARRKLSKLEEKMFQFMDVFARADEEEDGSQK